MPKYKTKLKEWRDALEDELDRRVLWNEIEKRTDLAYSTLQKHQVHTYSRPDYAAATRVCQFFRETSTRKFRRVTPLDYFEVVENGQD